MSLKVRTLLLAAALVAPAAHAQPGYPSKPIRLIVTAQPGTPGDVVARIIAEPLAAGLGQAVIVENRVGAINTIGLAAVAKAEPDGYTIGVLGLPATIAPSLLTNMPYDTLRDLAPVRQLSWVSNVLVVRPGVRLASIEALVAAAKARPGSLTYASGGNGTPAHLAAELFKRHAGVDIHHVPFKGALAGVSAVMGDQVDLMFATAPAAAGQIKAGKLVAVATSSSARIPALPEVPTMAELGYAAVAVRDWHGIVAPAATPKPIIQRLDSELAKALAEPGIADRLAKVGLEPAADSDPDKFGQWIAAELARWSKVVREAGIKPD